VPVNPSDVALNFLLLLLTRLIRFWFSD